MTETDEKLDLNINAKNIVSLADKAFLYLKAKKILLVGQERAGKTRLFEYLVLNTYLQSEDEESEVTVDEVSEWFKKVTISSGGGEAELLIRKLADQSGQSGPFIHAGLAMKYKPHLVFVVLDVTTSLHGARTSSGGTWSRHFFTKLGRNLSKSRWMQRNLKCICVLLNKQDALDSNRDTKLREYKTEIQEYLDKYIHPNAENLKTIIEPSTIVTLEDEDEVRRNLNRILFNAAKNL